ncbi:MAG: CNT family concentrative nucleoside transporter [Planctomycetota bacterium]|jgi:CNT family concentrative nucleoside transporter
MTILRALIGLTFFCVVAWLLSTDRKRVNVRVIIGGLLMQVVVALLVLQTSAGRSVLDSVSSFATAFMSFGEKGAEMVFGPLVGFMHEAPVEDGQPPAALNWYSSFPFQHAGEAGKVWIIFAFKALPTIIYFSAVMAILYYLGVMQVIIFGMAKFMTWTMRVSGAESLAMAANVFVGQTEAPLVVKPYIPGMTRSELMALMTGGFATIAGSVLAVYIGILGEDFAGHLLAASFMSAPAAFVMAKILVPESEQPATAGAVKLEIKRDSANILDAAATGTSDGLSLYLNVVAMLISFVAMVALVNWGISNITVGEMPLSLERIFGWVFAPVAWAMGVDWTDCQSFGTLLGTKVAVNEFVAFGSLGAMAADEAMSERSLQMAAYALCGFANFASVGIQIGGISPLAPERRKDLSRLALRAMMGGAFASWMTATVAGMFL